MSEIDSEKAAPKGVYALPYVGAAAQRARDVFDGLQVQPEDNLGVAIGKHAARAGVVIGATGVVMIVVL